MKCNILMQNLKTKEITKVYKEVDNDTFLDQNYDKQRFKDYKIINNEELEDLIKNNTLSISDFNNNTKLKDILNSNKIKFPLIVKNTAFDSEPYYICSNITNEYRELFHDNSIDIYNFYDSEGKLLVKPNSYKIVTKEELSYFR